MMKTDTQHLDFLISQYVDGCLEGANKKSVEQQLLNDPAARVLYNDHREVQDLLDDWGNRIPLIDWNEFDQKLSARLEQEVVGSERQQRVRRWLKPLAAAAALFIAAGIGYSWNAWWSPKGSPTQIVADVPTAAGSRMIVRFDDQVRATQPSQISFAVNEDGVMADTATKMAVTVMAPGDSAATNALRDSVMYGLSDVATLAAPNTNAGGGSVAVMSELQKPKKENAWPETIQP